MKNLITTDIVIATCKEKNFILKDIYTNSRTNMKVQCNNCGYHWETKWGQLKNQQGCVKCGKVRNKPRNIITINTVKNFCSDRNFTCVEDVYISSRTKMKIKCNICNYNWENNWSLLKKQQGCTRCTKTKKYTISEIQSIVKNKQCKTIETEYINNNTMMKWECLVETCRHVWKRKFVTITRPNNIGCPKCYYNDISLHKFEDVKKIAESKNLLCLTPIYKNAATIMKWKCKKCEREWETSFESISKSIGGCVKCTFKETICHNIDYVKNFIKDKGIICLSNVYFNNREKLKFQCNVCDNIWEATFHHIKDSLSGCPNCQSFRTERLCRELFQSFIGYNFPKARLPEMNRLELDGYCEELGVAFEYNGIQHYEHTEYFHTEEEFKAQQERDKLKLELCEKNKILLITIPHEYDYKDPDRLEKYILNQLITNNVIL